VVLGRQALPLISTIHQCRVQVLLCAWWSHEDRPALPFQLDQYGRYVLVVGKAEDYSSADEIEVRVEGMGIVELDADGHDG
jgi:hypothetical protein